MLDKRTYIKTIRELKDQIEDDEYEVFYRQIELLGHTIEPAPSMVMTTNTISCGVTYNQEEQRILNSDSEYQKLLYRLTELRNLLDFVTKHADFPMEVVAE